MASLITAALGGVAGLEQTVRFSTGTEAGSGGWCSDFDLATIILFG